MVITYSSHAKQKLLIRRISREDIESLIAHPTELFEDIEHGCEVSVGTIGDKLIVAVYQKVDKDIKVITVYHTLLCCMANLFCNVLVKFGEGGVEAEQGAIRDLAWKNSHATQHHTRKLDKLVSAKLQRGAWRRIR